MVYINLVNSILIFIALLPSTYAFGMFAACKWFSLYATTTTLAMIVPFTPSELRIALLSLLVLGIGKLATVCGINKALKKNRFERDYYLVVRLPIKRYGGRVSERFVLCVA